jgi:sulfur carrier protein
VLTVNGKTHTYETEMTLGDLLEGLQLSETLCAIEVNNALVPHNERNEYKLQDEDKVEIVSLVGGG